MNASQHRAMAERRIRSYTACVSADGDLSVGYVAEHAVHVSGLVIPPSDGVIALIVVRNGGYFIEEFLRHYRSLGVRHFVFLDNGSDDGTDAILAHEDDVSVWKCDLPFGTFDLLMRRWLLGTFARDRWALQVDIDEFFDFPLRGFASVDDLADYNDERGFRAVRSLMVDLFPRCDIRQAGSMSPSEMRRQHRFVDWSDIECINAQVTDRSERCYRGGIRRKIFGGGNDLFYLTKHPFIRCDDPESYTHHQANVPIADFNGIVEHYKFAGDFAGYVEDCVNRNAHWNDSIEYRAYASALHESQNVNLHSPQSEEYRGIAAVVDRGFIAVPASYRRRIGSNFFEAAVDRRKSAVNFSVKTLHVRRVIESWNLASDYVFLPSVFHYFSRYSRWLHQVRGYVSTNIDADRVTAVLLSYRRPHNIQALVASLIAAGRIGRIVVINNNPSFSMSRYFHSSDPYVSVIDNAENTGAVERYSASRRMPGRYFLSIDDDTFLSPDQIDALCDALLANPEVPHGLYGQFVDSADVSGQRKFRSGIECINAHIDILNRVYAFTAEHVDRFFDLLSVMNMSDARSMHALSIADDVVMSFCGIGKPVIHDLGPILACPTSDAKRTAQWRSRDFDLFRSEMYSRLEVLSPSAS